MNSCNYNVIPLLYRYFKSSYNIVIQNYMEEYKIGKFTLKSEFDIYTKKYRYFLNYLIDIKYTEEDFIYKERYINQEEFKIIKEKCFELKNAGILIEHTVYLEKC